MSYLALFCRPTKNFLPSQETGEATETPGQSQIGKQTHKALSHLAQSVNKLKFEGELEIVIIGCRATCTKTSTTVLPSVGEFEERGVVYTCHGRLINYEPDVLSIFNWAHGNMFFVAM